MKLARAMLIALVLPKKAMPINIGNAKNAIIGNMKNWGDGPFQAFMLIHKKGRNINGDEKSG